MVSLEALDPSNHAYRKFKELWYFTDIAKEMKKMEVNSDHIRIWSLQIMLMSANPIHGRSK